MATRVKKAPLIAIVVIVAGIIGFRYAAVNGLLSPADNKASVPQSAALPEVTAAPHAAALIPAATLPSPVKAAPSGPEVRMNVMAWNGQFGLAFANGGPQTTSGSLMEKHSVNLSIIREDDCNKMQSNLVSFAKALKGGDAQPTAGSHFVIIMGDGSAAFLAGLNGELSKLGPDYIGEVVGAIGRSNGEDKFMAEPTVKQNPKSAKGILIAGVCRDGDWNIAMKWAGDNGIKNNPSEKTYDPEAINWMCVDDFVMAGTKYIEGACEDRPVIMNDKRTGETKHICVNGVVTWTPGDVTVAQKKGGLVSVVSTKEYRSQMPTTIIGIKKWDQANSTVVENLLDAALAGGDQVKAFPTALHRAAEASMAIYKEESAEYWEKYYKGVTETDMKGLSVPLGGSYAFNLNDALQEFGLVPGSANLFAATYTVFGDIVHQQYPNLVPNYPAATAVVNTSYLQHVSSRVKSVVAADVPVFKGGAPMAEVVSHGSYSITFDTGRATVTGEGEKALKQLANNLLVSNDLAIEIDGHTDNTGSPEANLALSKARAEAVRNWLVKFSPSAFPEDRFTVRFFGQSKPVATNDNEKGRDKNRRVEIIQGTQG